MVRKSLVTFLILVLLSVSGGLIGCEKKGSAERAGEQVDDAAKDIKHSVRDAKDEVDKIN
jgi:hypothetical protein